MRLPSQRGPLSSALFSLLKKPPHDLPAEVRELAGAPDAEDAQITLFACYALHYAGFDNVDSRWEWSPSLLSIRGALEDHFERSLRELAGAQPDLTAQELPGFLLRLGAPAAGPSLARFMKDQASADQYREFVIHRSLYNVMEADPHSWCLPRLSGEAKCALVEIQMDEYGNGLPGRMHSELFQKMMVELALDPSYGGYIEQVPAVSIAPVNAASMFGLHRRLRGALLGNLAMIEIGSSFVNRCFSGGLARLGAPVSARWFFDEHVEADAAHEQIAAYNMCGIFARQCPAEADEVIFGAVVSNRLSQLSNEAMLQNWASGRGSLRYGMLRPVLDGGVYEKAVQ